MARKTIYISSTFADLQEYRESAARTIEDFGHTPRDSYHAGPEPVVESCLKDVDGCDALVGIVAWRLGWAPPDGDSRTITQREFERAAGKPRLIFPRDESMNEHYPSYCPSKTRFAVHSFAMLRVTKCNRL
jgi:hypothetical protein